MRRSNSWGFTWVFCATILILTLHFVVTSDCPPCFKDMNNVKVAGNGYSDDGRPVITVQIATSGTGSWSVDDSGNAQSNTNYHIWNAVTGCEGCVPPDGAIGMWNKAPDTGQP